jgi:hypothetical protein
MNTSNRKKFYGLKKTNEEEKSTDYRSSPDKKRGAGCRGRGKGRGGGQKKKKAAQ